MPTIEISDDDFRRFQQIAVPFVDTPATVCRKLLDYWFDTRTTSLDTAPATEASSFQTYRESDIPDLIENRALLHTKFLAGRFGDKKPLKHNWDAMVRLSLVTVIDRYKTVPELRRVSGANVVPGTKSNEGYKPVQEHGFSYQGVSAEDAIKIVLRCAKAMGQSVYLEFEWRDKEAAYRPGERAAIQFGS